MGRLQPKVGHTGVAVALEDADAFEVPLLKLEDRHPFEGFRAALDEIWDRARRVSHQVFRHLQHRFVVLGVELPERLRHFKHRAREVADPALAQRVRQGDEASPLTGLHPRQRPGRGVEHVLDLPPSGLRDRVGQRDVCLVVLAQGREDALPKDDAVGRHVVRPPRDVLQERDEPVEVLDFERLHQLRTGVEELARQRARLPGALVQAAPHHRPGLDVPRSELLQGAVTRVEVARRQGRRVLAEPQAALRPLLEAAERH